MLSVEEIRRFIDEDAVSTKKSKAAEGQRYYDAKHDILNCRFFYFNNDEKLVEDKYRANNKICHPFFTELSDQLTSYMLSFEKNPIQAKEKETQEKVKKEKAAALQSRQKDRNW